MIELTTTVLQRLKCVKCEEYLSYPPILMTLNGDNICGRCVFDITTDFVVLNHLFENFVEELEILFPCRYSNIGCTVKRLICDMKIHEDKCKYRYV